jgi:hypothetical protein
MRAAVSAMLVVLLWTAQQSQPLRKTDLIRVLTGGALSKVEIADLVRRNCISFTPTPRDRQDLVSLGADSAIMRRVDACVAAAAVPAPRPRPATPPPAAAPGSRPVRPPTQTVRPSAPATTTTTPTPSPVASAPARVVAPPPTVPPVVRAPSAARTGFVSGLGQRGVVGQRVSLPLIFEVRDSAGRPLAGVAVAITVSNGRMVNAPAATDSLGQMRGDVVLGERAAPTIVTASVGRIVRQALLYPVAGPPARVVAAANGQSVDRQLVIDPDAVTTLRVGIQDAFGNPVAAPGVVAAVADAGVMRVMRVTPDSLGATVLLRPGRAGGASTTLALQAGSVRLDLKVSVRARPAR